MKKITLILALLSFLGMQVIMAQTTVTGTVTDDSGAPIPGATIVPQSNAQYGTLSESDGSYKVEVPAGETHLKISFLGKQDQVVEIAGRSVINVTLKGEDVVVEDVIVVAYGTAKKSSYTGAVGVVDSKDLEIRTVTSITSALEGATTGVQLTSSSGQPGSAPNIRIRGFGTLNGVASPLYVVDGAQYEGDISNINPDDIASMTILKDASSTALYGARAANGVVMITTKKGKKGAGLKVNVKSVNGIVSQAIPYYETAEAGDYYELIFEAYKNSLIYRATNPLSPDAAAADAVANIYSKLKYNPFNVPNNEIVGLDGKLNPNAKLIAPSLNWYEPLEQVGFRQNHNISVTGGGEDHDFLLSIGYLDETGYVVESNYERINARMNFNARPKKWLNVGTNFAGVLTTKGLSSAADGNTSYANPFFFARNMGPIYPVYIADPLTGEYILDAAGEKQYDLGGGYTDLNINARPVNPNRHIVAELDYNNNIAKANNISNRSYVDFEFMEGLKFTVSYSIDINNYKDSEFENPIVGDGAPTGRYNQTRFSRTTTNFNQLLNYQKSLAGVHNFDVLLGHENFSREYTENYGMMSQQIVDGIYEFDNFVTPTSLSGYTSNKKNEGYFFRLNYNYNSKYYLSASYRYDGSSVFHEDVRWGGFFSVGASWMIDNENFAKNITWLDELKFRTSYGQVGNDLIGGFYAYQALYATFPNASSPGLVWSEVGNSQLTWESNNSFDLALDFGIFKNKLHGSIEYYKKVSADLLYNMPLPLSMGLSSQPRNIATLYNQGFEFGLGSTVINTDNFTWDINIQASTIKNEITEIPDPFVSGSKRWAVGHSIYDFYMYEYYGVNSETGAPQYQVWEEDAEGNTTRKYNEDGTPVLAEKYSDAGKGYIGESAIPDLFGSITNKIRYKNFSLDVLLTYSLGGKVLDYGYATLMNGGTYGNSIHIDQLDGWRQAGDQTDIPRLEIGNTNINPTSSRWLTDASYLSIRNINFSYTFNDIISDKLNVDDLRIFVAGENLAMFNARKGMDSQESFDGTTSNVYLPSRVFSLGVNLTF